MKLSTIAIAAGVGFVLAAAHKRNVAPPASQAYSAGQNPNGFVFIPGYGWRAADPLTGREIFVPLNGQGVS